MKDYLNQIELNDFMIIGSMMDSAGKILGINRDPSVKTSMQTIRRGWFERNNMTKDEHKNLKMAETYLVKWYESVLARLSGDELLKIQKRLSSFNYRIMDNFTLKKINRELEKDLGVVKLKREEFDNWCAEIMAASCKDCTKHHSECTLCSLFEETLVPESSWMLENCRYSYKSINKKVEEKINE